MAELNVVRLVCHLTPAADGVGREDDGRDIGVAGAADRRSGRPVRHQVGDWTRDHVQAGGNQGNSFLHILRN